MDRVAIAAALVVLAGVVALLLRRRRPEPPTQSRWQVPMQLDRGDFSGTDRPWLLVVFTSSTCESCARVTAKAAPLESPSVAYQEVSYQADRALHDRYAIDVVPMTLLADAEGAVHASFVGEPSATELWAAVDEIRQQS